ncbi:Predicted arabinose efflux permease, MFS family [Sulfurivirga caldicuralii]|uniref:Predicted arabinose efflux permease, MFS family n=1 Tax=Sulfurivirga caldicuralii TaxID=364032 RepID=A0A1N6GRA2_9GAMM|nr:MFS transporter [Sulfurivirga caldicuralii]SIO09905.1 Predicted arabinose efflux permease, MFS family [Sulfurivirga caldicuralii]
MKQIPLSMTPEERKATFAIAGVFATRMLGLFMIFPVFAIFAHQAFAEATGTQIGLAMGIYGLTQALLQIPFGLASDKWGRKPLIIGGMLVFAIGSVICAVAPDMETMIFGRAVQGMGAVAAVLTALVADLVREPLRLRAMSIVGMTIGLSFTLSLILGPILSQFWGVRGIFWAIAALAVIGMLLVIFVVPTPKTHKFQREAEVDPRMIGEVLRHPQLLRLDFGVFSLHAMLTAMFVVVPLLIAHKAGLDTQHHWKLYLPVMLLSFLLMVPFIIQAESKGRMKQIFIGAIATLGLVNIAFNLVAPGYWSLFILLMVFFTAFNLLEASLPSLVVKLAPPDKKGTASGVYSTSQFLGAALGGALGGWLYQYYGMEAVFWGVALLSLLWLGVAITMEKPQPLSIASIPIPFAVTETNKTLVELLISEQPGVAAAVVVPEENTAYVKIDRKVTNEVILGEVLEDSNEDKDVKDGERR